MMNQSRRNFFKTGLAGALVLPVFSSGCVWDRVRNMRNPFSATAEPCVLEATASKEEIVEHLNQNISRLTSWRSTRVKIHLKQSGALPVDLNANVAVRSPSYFRLRASSLMGEEADFGSNPERFWFWVKRSPEPVVMTASHEHLGIAQQRLPFPFEPNWVMEALGVILIDPEPLTLEHVSDTRVNLVSQHRTQNNGFVRKVVGVDLCRGQVIEHSLQSADGQVIARATMSDYRASTHSVSVPYTVTLEWPQAGTRMRLSLLDVEINPSYTPEQVWEMPTTLGQIVDLGRANLGQ